MKAFLGLTAILALLALTACVPESDSQDYTDTMSQSERSSCEAEGGRIGIAGLMGGEFCVRPNPSAGQSCARSSECGQGLCQSDTRTCEAELNPYGCKNYLDDDGVAQSICVD